MEKNPEIGITVEISCHECGNELKGEFSEARGKWTLDVEVCQTCKNAAIELGKDQGREEQG